MEDKNCAAYYLCKKYNHVNCNECSIRTKREVREKFTKGVEEEHMTSYLYEGRRTANSENLLTLERVANELISDLLATMKRKEMVGIVETMRFSFEKREVKLKCEMVSKDVNIYEPKAIYRNGKTTAVKWNDGTVTKVKLQDNEPDSPYSAFVAAVAKKALGTNSKLKRIVDKKTIEQKK